MELRAAQWQDQKPKVAEGPSTLDAVAKAQEAEEVASSSPSSRHSKREEAGPSSPISWRTKMQTPPAPSDQVSFQQRPSNDDDCYFGRQCRKPGCRYLHPEGRELDEEQAVPFERKEANFNKLSKLISICKPCEKSQPREPKSPDPVLLKLQKVKRRYRKNVCKKEVAAALSAFRATKDLQQALLDIAAIAVPTSKQAEELSDMLAVMMREDSAATRQMFFDMAARLFLEGLWSEMALTSGLQNLLETGRAELERDLPAFSSILWDEVHPALAPIVSKAISK